ncbi:carboxymuconolactone decarboxylase family protein [Thalassomonas haliotis]|uniref:Carboxymuconolactone decarboxylase family protein n=1 Tax=Thalassomonas haliotis TaxID=485448 RepID=A0ABY7VE81_9GAMM|nr:carboxymuconolactone decarboxylase family protein [Thalassomonas haliotis]WDE12002.1 carboxymuconolactone decarboxylase family protein [Thalassomonas haliotis]
MPRVNIQERQPEAYNAMFGLEKYLASSSVDADLQEIIRIRASILNGCQFCLGMHSEAAKKLGVSDEKLHAVENWQQSKLFNEKEQAVLAMTDSVTHISAKGLPTDVYQKASEFFNEDEMAQLITLMATINAWNRLGVAMAG